MRSLALFTIALALVSCRQEDVPGAASRTAADDVLEEGTENMLAIYRSEGLRFSPAYLRDEQTSAMFEGRGERSFWFAAAGCLGAYWTEMGSHIAYVTSPSENSALFKDRTSDWKDSDAINCFQSNSEVDFYVSRVPNFAAVDGESIMPESE